LGVIPVVGKRLRRKTVLQRFREKPKSGLAEAVRSLRTSILFSNVDMPPKVVMFTSSVPREGKSTTATLVAMTSRQMGKSAIIVDCDLRLPALADLLGTKSEGPGLLSAIEGTATLEEAIHRDEESGLHVLMTKPSEPRSTVNAADILSSKRFDDMIEELKRTYDLVILDTPPTLAVADPRILSSHADVVVYVVRWDHTPRGAVAEGLKELRTINAPIGGVVLSMLNESKATRYAYEGYNSYRGRYRNYYVD
jgi:succinoglycan biosynthesis transport protein ExoP